MNIFKQLKEMLAKKNELKEKAAEEYRQYLKEELSVSNILKKYEEEEKRVVHKDVVRARENYPDENIKTMDRRVFDIKSGEVCEEGYVGAGIDGLLNVEVTAGECHSKDGSRDTHSIKAKMPDGTVKYDQSGTTSFEGEVKGGVVGYDSNGNVSAGGKFDYNAVKGKAMTSQNEEGGLNFNAVGELNTKLGHIKMEIAGASAAQKESINIKLGAGGGLGDDNLKSGSMYSGSIDIKTRVETQLHPEYHGKQAGEVPPDFNKEFRKDYKDLKRDPKCRDDTDRYEKDTLEIITKDTIKREGKTYDDAIDDLREVLCYEDKVEELYQQGFYDVQQFNYDEQGLYSSYVINAKMDTRIVIGNEELDGVATYDHNKHLAGDVGVYNLKSSSGREYILRQEGADLHIIPEAGENKLVIKSVLEGVKPGHLDNDSMLFGTKIEDPYQDWRIHDELVAADMPVTGELIIKTIVAKEQYKEEIKQEKGGLEVSTTALNGTKKIDMRHWSEEIKLDGTKLEGTAYNMGNDNYMLYSGNHLYRLQVTGEEQLTVERIKKTAMAKDKVIIDNYPVDMAKDGNVGGLTDIKLSNNPLTADEIGVPAASLNEAITIMQNKSTKIGIQPPQYEYSGMSL